MSYYTHLGGMFWKSESGVFCEWNRLKLDPGQTKVHYDAWATDGERVYFHSLQRRKIDASSFIALNGWYAKDAAAGYCGFLTSLKNADVNTLEVIDSGNENVGFGSGKNGNAGYARDRSQVFFDGMIVINADPASFVSLGNCYGRDANSIFYTRFRLNGVAPLRWRYLGSYYSCDDQRVYYVNRTVKNVQVDNFRLVETGFAYDGLTLFAGDKPTTTDYYVKCLRQRAGFASDIADLVESGVWQRNLQKSEWHYRAPDEVLQAYRTIKLGDPLLKIEKSLGQGESVPREHWDFFFPPLDRMIRPGFSEGAGTVPWSGANSRTPPGCQVWRWIHPEQVLACSFLDDKVIAKVKLESEYATPPGPE